MALFISGVKLNNFSIGPDTSPGDLVPEDMQYGRIGFSQGKRVVGSGKAFAAAGYGSGKVKMMLDENGNEKYGISIFTRIAPNIVFIAPTTTGDMVRQSKYSIDLESGTPVEIGKNQTATGKIYAIHKDNRFKIYLENIENAESEINYFYGKDNNA